jgi:hypothetical protein
MRNLIRASSALSAGAALFLMAYGCSGANSSGSNFGPPDSNDASGGNDGSGGDGGNGGDDGGTIHLGDSGHPVSDAACAAAATKAQQEPLDMFIMLDQSGSMNEMVPGNTTKWAAVTGALNTFVGTNDPTIAVGIQYFALPASGSTCPTSCNTDTDCGSSANGPCVFNTCIGCSGAGGDSCNAADYARAEVEIAALPGNGPPIQQSISHHMPNSSTPTSAALQGAIDHQKTWAPAHPGHVSIVVLATDGDPTECDTNLSNINAIAASGVSNNPKILTFVIGVGTSFNALNGIAAAGGTGQALIVDTTQNVNQQFLAALNQIRGAALGCTYKIPVPEAGTVDFGQVNVQYKPGNGGMTQLIPQVPDAAHCPSSGLAWYYDHPNAPTQILLCQSTCSTVSADTHGGEIDVLTGCQTIVR